MSSALAVIEALLQEFYQATTPNGRKRQIETELLSLKSQPDAWQLCLRVVSAMEPNQYLWFFAASTLEHVITRRWSLLATEERALLRETLWTTYASLCVDVPRRQRDTIAQLIALMGKREFPDDHPNYLMHCIELTRTQFRLGITLLRTTSEEVVSNREDVTTDRKNYFHSCVSMCIPDVMDVATKFLLIAVCHINGKDLNSIPNNYVDFSLHQTLPNDNQLSSSLLELLQCVQHLVSWIRTDLISEYFLLSILDLSQWRGSVAQQDEISLAALNVLNELLYLQKPLPYAHTLIGGVNGLLDQHNTSAKHQSEMYVDKFRELLRMYTIKYWQKVLQENESLDRFLKSLYCCTIFRNGALDFTEKLEIWTPIIKGLVMNSKLQRYNTVVNQLVMEIMRRTQFEFNKTELELLDNDALEDSTQTEWQQFLTQCLECVALVAESRPTAIFGHVLGHWARPYAYLQPLEQDIDALVADGGAVTYELLRTKLKCPKFSENLRDLATVCQAMARIAPMLDVGASSEVSGQLQSLADNLLRTLQFLAGNKLGSLEVDKTLYQTDLDYLYAQVLAALRSVLPIITASVEGFKLDETLHKLFAALGDIFLPQGVPAAPLVYLSASQLLLCISSVIRPKCLLEIGDVARLMQAGPNLSTHLPRPVVANIYTSLISYLVQPWRHGVDQTQPQDFTSRCALLREYVECLARTFLELDAAGAEAKVAANSTELLATFGDVLEYFRDVGNNAKEMLATGFRCVLTKALTIYNNFGSCSDTLAVCVADFSLSVLRTLPNQLGSPFLKEMISLFIMVSSRTTSPANFARLVVIEKLLQMFKLIVEQPSSSSLNMLPAILDFTMEHLLPLLHGAEGNDVADQTDISQGVYALFDSILTCKWQYFYKSHFPQNGGLQHPSNGPAAMGENLHPEHFMGIMNAYGRALLVSGHGSDPSIVRMVLQSLQNVNDRWRLYQRPLFKQQLLPSFQDALLKVLLAGEGALHYDMLANALFSMGQVDALKLRESFAQTLGGYAPNNLKTIDELCLTNDIPTFSQKLTQLIQDSHCVHMAQQT